LVANTVTMASLASLLSRYTDRPVVDCTGLTGRFDVVLESAEIPRHPIIDPVLVTFVCHRRDLFRLPSPYTSNWD
jgi:uncharacterized protein (TIGR03435 family)